VVAIRLAHFTASLVALSVLTSPLVADEVTDAALAARVDKLFAAWDKPDSPGAAVGIIRDGKLLVARGYGRANLDDNVPITPRSVFEVGSVTKSFTCVCVALLLDQGKISPDDGIRKYVPEMPAYDPPVTIRHLIRCECGLRDYFHLMQVAGWNIEDAYTAEDALALLSRQKTLPFQPGQKYSYTSSGYFLLGQMVQRVTEHSLARFAHDNVFKPLGMNSTHYEDDPTAVVKNRAVGYDAKSGGGFRRWMMTSGTVGGWGLKSTVEDLYRWDQNFYRNKLPEGRYLKEFLRSGTLLGNRNVLDLEPVERYRGLRRVEFTGGMPGFATALVRFPDEKFAVICLANDSRVAPWTVAKEVADLYLADRFTEPSPNKKVDPMTFAFIELPERELAGKPGVYRMNNGRIWKVTLRDGGLTVTDHLNGTWRLRALSPTRFRVPDSPIDKSTLVFEQKSADAPVTLRMEVDDGSTIDFERVTLVEPGPKELADCAGVYYNDEVQATYRFFARDGALFLQVNNRRHERLVPTLRDTFIASVRRPDDNRIITFVRDEEKRVTALTIDLWRVKGLRFQKQKDRKE
jgi:CubicO group peptidase (beta-lactamase class C family)